MTRKEVSIGSNYPTGLPVSHPPNKAPMILRKGLKMVASSVLSSHDDGGRPNSARITAAAAREQLSLGIVDLHLTCTPRSGSDPSQIHLRCFLSACGFTPLCAVGDDGGSSAVTNELRRGRTMDCCGLATHSTVKASVAEHSSAQEAAAIGCECMRRCGEVDLTVTPD